MTTALYDLSAAIATALSPLCGGRIYLGKYWQLPEGLDSMIFVYPELATQAPAGLAAGPLDWKTGITVEIRTRFAPETETPVAAIDALLASAWPLLKGVGGTGIQQIVPGAVIRYEFGDVTKNVVGVSLFCDVIHRTDAQNLAAW